MNFQPATVVELAGSHAWVETGVTGSECARCSSGSGCGAAPPVPRRYRVRNEIAARAGEQVELVAAPGIVWRAAAVSYLMPLALGCSLAAIGQRAAGDGLAVAGLLAGVSAGWLLMRLTGHRLERGGELLSMRRRTNVISVMKETS